MITMPIDKSACFQCETEPYRLKGRTYKFCAKCGWHTLVVLMGYVDDKKKTAKEQIDEIYFPYKEWANGDN